MVVIDIPFAICSSGCAGFCCLTMLPSLMTRLAIVMFAGEPSPAPRSSVRCIVQTMPSVQDAGTLQVKKNRGWSMKLCREINRDKEKVTTNIDQINDATLTPRKLRSWRAACYIFRAGSRCRRSSSMPRPTYVIRFALREYRSFDRLRVRADHSKLHGKPRILTIFLQIIDRGEVIVVLD